MRYLLEPVQIPADGFDNFEPDSISSKLLLFQTGYLTIKRTAQSQFSEEFTYTLGIPNEEVRKSLMVHLVGSYAECPVSDTTELRDFMLQQLFDGDVSATIDV